VHNRNDCDCGEPDGAERVICGRRQALNQSNRIRLNNTGGNECLRVSDGYLELNMTTHPQARELAKQALTTVFGEEPTEGEVWALAGIACLETNYGDGWKPPGTMSYNMGAIQCGSQWTGARFAYTDTHPNADGSSTPYNIYFRKYASAIDGWIDLVKVAFVNRGRDIVREAARAKDWGSVSAGLHQTGYYEGFGKTVADRIHHHMLALEGAIARANAACLVAS
jgi:hypothetical protein